MIFLPIILLLLGAAFIFFGRREENSVMVSLGVCMLIAAFGTGLITFFAWQALHSSGNL